jgi:hypothetical protein
MDSQPRLIWRARWVARKAWRNWRWYFWADVEVVEPESLREQVAGDLERAAGRYR